MTDPTPTRAEVERFDIVNVAYSLGEYVNRIEQQEGGRFVRFTDCEALLERAEAAEKESAEWRDQALRKADALIAARRAEAAAWEAGEKLNEACSLLFAGLVVETLEPLRFEGDLGEVLAAIGSARAPFSPFGRRRAAPTEDR